MDKFVDKFAKELDENYRKLYNGEVKGDRKLIDKFDKLLKTDKTFKLLVAFYNVATNDIISSDRQVNAFMLTVENW